MDALHKLVAARVSRLRRVPGSIPSEHVRAEGRVTKKLSIDESCDRIDEPWRPRVIAALNGQEVKLIS